MPIQTRTLNELIVRIHLMETGKIDSRKLSIYLSQALELAESATIPHDHPTIELRTRNSDELTARMLATELTPRQWRHNLITQYRALLDNLELIPIGGRTPSQNRAVSNIAQALQTTTDRLREVASHDPEPISFLPFRLSEIGRRCLTRAIAHAREEAGPSLSKARPIVEAQMLLAYRNNLAAYLDDQFPTGASDSARPKLQHLETLILAREFYEALDDTSNQKAAAKEIARFLVEGQNRLRYDLPAEEGIATADYWYDRITEGFENAPMLAAHNYLRNPTLQDEMPVDRVISALGNASRYYSSLPLNAVEPVIHYLGDDVMTNADVLLQMGKVKENRIVVFRDNDGNPAVATPHDPSTATSNDPALPNHMRVVRSGYRAMIGEIDDDEDLSIEERLEARLDTLSELSSELSPISDWDSTRHQIETLSNRWRYLVSKHLPGNVATFQSELADLHRDMKAVSKRIPMPEYSDTASLDNARSLTRLAFASGFYSREDNKFTFRAPEGVGTRATGDQPDLEIVFDNQGESSNIHLKTIGEPTSTLAFIESVPNPQATEQARKEAMHYGRYVGISNAAFPVGLVTYELNQDGSAAIPTGHWLSSGDREKHLVKRPMHLASLQLHGQPLFDPEGIRTQADTQDLKLATTGLLHGESITDLQASVAAEVASYDGDYMLEVDIDDQFGCEKIHVPEFVFAQLTNEDIKRHLVQQVSQSTADYLLRDQMVQRIANTSWDQASRRMDRALEETELAQQMAPGM